MYGFNTTFLVTAVLQAISIGCLLPLLRLVRAEGAPRTADATSAASARVANGIQIFPGSVPIYRGSQLIGGIGVSGDGVDQDDMIALLAVHQAGQRLGTVNNAPPSLRADTLTPRGHRLRYVNCPQAPFLDSDTHDACGGKSHATARPSAAGNTANGVDHRTAYTKYSRREETASPRLDGVARIQQTAGAPPGMHATTHLPRAS